MGNRRSPSPETAKLGLKFCPRIKSAVLGIALAPVFSDAIPGRRPD